MSIGRTFCFKSMSVSNDFYSWTIKQVYRRRGDCRGHSSGNVLMSWPGQASWYNPLCSKLGPSWFWTNLWASASGCPRHPGEQQQLLVALPGRWSGVEARAGEVLVDAERTQHRFLAFPGVLLEGVLSFISQLSVIIFFSFYNKHKIIYFLFS